VKAFEAEWRARFERFGRTYREEHAISGWSAEGLARRLRLFGQVLAQMPVPEHARVLELGCGPGTYVRYLGDLGHSVVGVDYSLPSLHRAVGADEGRKGCYVAADGYHLPFTQETFDLVVCIGVFQAVCRPPDLLSEMVRVLRQGGLVLVEALNATEVPAMVRRLGEMAKRQPPRLHTYPAARVRRWFEARDLHVLRRVGVFLPLRSQPAIGRWLDHPPVMTLLERAPLASLLLAHAFWFVGQKAA